MSTLQLLDVSTGIVHTLDVFEKDAQRANEGKNV